MRRVDLTVDGLSSISGWQTLEAIACRFLSRKQEAAVGVVELW